MCLEGIIAELWFFHFSEMIGLSALILAVNSTWRVVVALQCQLRVGWVKNGSFPTSPAHLVTKRGSRGNALHKCNTVRFGSWYRLFTFFSWGPLCLVFPREVATQQQWEDRGFWFLVAECIKCQGWNSGQFRGRKVLLSQTASLTCHDCLPSPDEVCRETHKKSKEEKVKNSKK